MKEPIKIEGQDALKAIFDSYYMPLVIFANGFVTELGACEDMVQETFVALWKSHSELPNEKALRSYLYKTVKNKCYNNLKHQKVKNAYAERTVAQLKSESFERDNEVDAEITGMLYAAIGKLSERRKAVVRFSLKGLRNQEIAERMEIKVQTVKTLKSQAYRSLRDFFGKAVK